MEVITDRKITVDDATFDALTGDLVSVTSDGIVDYFEADVVQYSDYYPYGMAMPNRNGSIGSKYRYAFNGMETDQEVSGSGNSYTTQFRQYDPRLGRWKSSDPLEANYPDQSTYAAFNDNPLYFIDPLGLEGAKSTGNSSEEYPGKSANHKADDEDPDDPDDKAEPGPIKSFFNNIGTWLKGSKHGLNLGGFDSIKKKARKARKIKKKEDRATKRKERKDKRKKRREDRDWNFKLPEFDFDWKIDFYWKDYYINLGISDEWQELPSYCFNRSSDDNEVHGRKGAYWTDDDWKDMEDGTFDFTFKVKGSIKIEYEHGGGKPNKTTVKYGGQTVQSKGGLSFGDGVLKIKKAKRYKGSGTVQVELPKSVDETTGPEGFTVCIYENKPRKTINIKLPHIWIHKKFGR